MTGLMPRARIIADALEFLQVVAFAAELAVAVAETAVAVGLALAGVAVERHQAAVAGAGHGGTIKYRLDLARPDLVAIVEREYVIGPSVALQDAM